MRQQARVIRKSRGHRTGSHRQHSRMLTEKSRKKQIIKARVQTARNEKERGSVRIEGILLLG